MAKKKFKAKSMNKRAKSSLKPRGRDSANVWRRLQKKTCYRDISDELGFTMTAIKNFAKVKFKDEATKLWAKEIRKTGSCEICGATVGLNAHHLLAKSVWPQYRCDLSNGICLCSSHHTFDNTISAHGCMVAVDRFIQWFKENRPGQYEWYAETKEDKRRVDVDWEWLYFEMKDGRFVGCLW